MLNCDIRAYSAVGDGVTLCTAAIQAAIDDCASHGGGRVTIAEGRYLCGTIRLKSGVELHIERDGVLLGSTDPEDFPDIVTDFWRTEYAPRFNKRCFIYAEGAQDIAITGRGVIDCQGRAFVDPLPPEKVLTLAYSRKPHPVDPDGDGLVYIDGRGHQPHMVCTSPARVVFFIGCRNVLVEDVIMREQPAGWSYWICDCEDVHFHRACIDASVEMPNNDGIHINCSRRITVSDCSITCADDAIVVRAYSLPLHKNTVCEKIAVTNCNLTSHACAVRLGWINDGVIRNCTFSNLNITDSSIGLGCYLPGNPTPLRTSDQGEEATHVENVSFSNITMDRVYHAPIFFRICEDNLCDAIKNIYFSGVHAYAGHMPHISGRPDCHVQSIYFDNCHFFQQRYEDMGTIYGDRFAAREAELAPPVFRYVDNLVMNGTVFSVL